MGKTNDYPTVYRGRPCCRLLPRRDKRLGQRVIMDNYITALDKGYVRLVEHMGSDLLVTNSARASYMKESVEFDDKDARLIAFLGRRKEFEPFRHAFMSFEIKAPLMVCRQWYRYAVASNHGELTMAWSEASRRYVTMEPEFYIPAPDEWRTKPANSKQGSAEPLDVMEGKMLTWTIEQAIEDGLARYNYALEKGVAPEIARGFLPAYFMYTVWRWSCSLQSVLFFLSQRLKDDAQKEIQEYARAVAEVVEPLYPYSYKAFLGEDK